MAVPGRAHADHCICRFLRLKKNATHFRKMRQADLRATDFCTVQVGVKNRWNYQCRNQAVNSNRAYVLHLCSVLSCLIIRLKLNIA